MKSPSTRPLQDEIHASESPLGAYRKSNQNHIRWKRLQLPKRSTSTIVGWLKNQPSCKNIRQVLYNLPQGNWGWTWKIAWVATNQCKHWAPKNIDIENNTGGFHASWSLQKLYHKNPKTPQEVWLDVYRRGQIWDTWDQIFFRSSNWCSSMSLIPPTKKGGVILRESLNFFRMTGLLSNWGLKLDPRN